MPALSHATRGTSKIGAILASLFLVAMLLPGAVLAATLTFTTTPAGATGGVPFTTQPKVTISLPDATSGTVSLAIGVNPSAGTLSGCAATLDSTTGTFTFSGCKIDKAGLGYTLVATSSIPGTVPAPSDAFDVTVGPAAKLAFTQAAIAGAAVGANLAPQPVVTIQDLGGNKVTSSTADVALAIKSGTPTAGGPGALACTANSVAAVLGVALFANCKINTNSGLGYVLHATSGSLAAADSNAFNITSSTATKLAFSAQPGGGTGGTAWTNQPVVQVQDASGNRVVTDDTTVVALAIGTNPGAGTLTCTGGLSKTVVSGQATFAGCTITKVGTGYTLVATSSPVLTSATSTAFNVTLGAAAKLGFTAQPTAATSNVAFPIQPVVAVQDLGGNTVTSSTATVTLAIGTNPAGGTLTCTSGLAKAAIAGVATFSGCQINNAGVGYTLTASATGLTGVTSTAFTVGAPAASITLTTSAPVSPGGFPTITWGGGIILTTQFGTNGGNKTFKLQATRDNVTWFDIGPLLTTDTAGRNAFAFRPSTNFFYRAVFAGTPDLAAGTSASVRTVVRQIALLRPTNGGVTKSISRNTSITFFTVVRPSRPELTPAKVTFSFYRLSGSTWVLSTQRTVTATAAGRAATTFTFSTSGQWYVRSMANPTTYNANSVMSSIERYSVN